jgi:hypothetical protein
VSACRLTLFVGDKIMTKNSPLFYEARDAVMKGTYLQAKKRHLQKYLAELSKVAPWEDDPLASGAVGRKREWIEKIKTELQRRKDEHRAHIRSIAKPVLIGLFVTIIGGIILYFFLPVLEDIYQSISKSLSQKSSKQQQNISVPQSQNMQKIKQPQPAEKTK